MSSSTPGPRRPRRSRGPTVRALTVGILVGVLVLGAVGAGFGAIGLLLGSGDPKTSTGGASRSPSPSPVTQPAPTPTGKLPTFDPALARFYEQKLDYTACGANRCADLTVPLDYADPGGRTIKVAVLVVPATDRARRLGSLVVNPGGPGGPGRDYAAAGSLQFGVPLTDRYDIVGFDPRGVGASTPLQCADTSELDALFAADPDPDTAAERDTSQRLIADLGAGCPQDLASHISTGEVIKDLDILRQSLGEATLDYLGASYGTLIGAEYADAFPDHVGRFVLDGALDPALSNEQLNLGQAKGFETALRAYVADCVKQGDCVLGDSVDQGTRRVRQLLADLEKRPLPTDTGRELTAGWAALGISLPLYVKEYWPRLTTALAQAIDDGRGSALLSFADLYVSRGPKGYKDNSITAFFAINCLDHADAIEVDEVPATFPEFLAASPTFGKGFAFGLSTCDSWPIKNGTETKALAAQGAPPIVVVGTTRDPATPYAWAVSLAQELDSGVLVSRDGDGHTGFQRGSTCVDDAVTGFLLAGTVPKDGLMCSTP